jgi:hypothetical protein
MKRVGDLISAIFDEKFMEKSSGYSAFFSCWEDLMIKNGIAAAAGHSWIKSAEKGLVWVEVDHPGWKQILQTKESKLLHDFRYRFPDMGISGISIVLCKPDSRDANPKAPSEKELPEPPKPVPSPAAETRNDDYGAIKDEALKKLLMRLEKQIAERENGQHPSNS